ncbi:MAG: hypothetical protein MJA82_09135 [Clostridia bacterium]|nr:hypothetical protein [Clostridia bacterium]
MKISKNKILTLILVTFLILMSTGSAFAQPDLSFQHDNMKNKLQVLEKNYNMEFTTDLNEISDLEMLEFDSIEEFESFIKSFKKSTEEAYKQDSIITLGSLSPVTTTSSKSKVYSNAEHISWWAPFSGYGFTGLACWKNITFEYKYTQSGSDRYFVEDSVKNIKSYLSGLNFISWKQTSAVGGLLSNKQVDFKINGYYLLGVSIGGFPLGAKLNATWRRSHRID